ncbi:MAG: response regulator [Pseudomonadota bacterium]|jgi:two-component system chemotaxis response regulator CheY|nr:response regulator [Mesorhizobium sp.]
MTRCMIVDDSSVIRKVAKRILTGPDMMVVEASTGAQALDMCAAQMPDIIVVDGGLTDMTTVEFIRQAVAVPSAIRPRIMICLTQFDLGAIMRAKRAGAAGFVLKPFNRPQLLERFRQFQAAA